MPDFSFFSSWVITAPAFISEPVPKTVTIVPSGMNWLGKVCLTISMSQMSSSSFACAEIILQQSDTEPPPTTRMRSTPFSRASFAPSCTFA